MIGICAYNEGHNLDKLLKRIIKETNDKILVVGGGEDSTKKTAESFAKRHKRINFIREKGKGKTYAMNLILKKSKDEDLLYIDGDNLPKEESISKLKEVLKKEDAVVGRLTPSPNFSNFWSEIIWGLHHLWCLKQPKLTQFFGIKNDLIDKISENVVNDDGYIQNILEKRKVKILYLPEAISQIRDRKNKSIIKFFQKRRRIAAGFIQLKKMGRDVSIPPTEILRLLMEYISDSPKGLFKAIPAVFLEVTANVFAYLDVYLRGEIPYNWKA